MMDIDKIKSKYPRTYSRLSGQPANIRQYRVMSASDILSGLKISAAPNLTRSSSTQSLQHRLKEYKEKMNTITANSPFNKHAQPYSPHPPNKPTTGTLSSELTNPRQRPIEPSSESEDDTAPSNGRMAINAIAASKPPRKRGSLSTAESCNRLDELKLKLAARCQELQRKRNEVFMKMNQSTQASNQHGGAKKKQKKTAGTDSDCDSGIGLKQNVRSLPVPPTLRSVHNKENIESTPHRKLNPASILKNPRGQTISCSRNKSVSFHKVEVMRPTTTYQKELEKLADDARKTELVQDTKLDEWPTSSDTSEDEEYEKDMSGIDIRLAQLVSAISGNPPASLTTADHSRNANNCGKTFEDVRTESRPTPVMTNDLISKKNRSKSRSSTHRAPSSASSKPPLPDVVRQSLSQLKVKTGGNWASNKAQSLSSPPKPPRSTHLYLEESQASESEPRSDIPNPSPRANSTIISPHSSQTSLQDSTINVTLHHAVTADNLSANMANPTREHNDPSPIEFLKTTSSNSETPDYPRLYKSQAIVYGDREPETSALASPLVINSSLVKDDASVITMSPDLAAPVGQNMSSNSSTDMGTKTKTSAAKKPPSGAKRASSYSDLNSLRDDNSILSGPGRTPISHQVATPWSKTYGSHDHLWGSNASLSGGSNLENTSELSGSRSSLSERLGSLRNSMKKNMKSLKRSLSLDRLSRSRSKESLNSSPGSAHSVAPKSTKSPKAVKDSPESAPQVPEMKKSLSLKSLTSVFSKKSSYSLGSKSGKVINKKSQKPENVDNNLARRMSAMPVCNPVASPKHARAIGKIIKLNADGSRNVKMVKPADGPYGFYFGPDAKKPGVYITRLCTSYSEKMLSGILSIGDRIDEINGENVTETNLDSIHTLISEHPTHVIMKLSPSVTLHCNEDWF